MSDKQKIFTAGSLDVAEWSIDFHNLMLGDTLRMEAYKKAIFESIKPGMVVCDLGLGTGILAKWALEAGAGKVYGIETNPELITVAQKELEFAGDKFIPVLGMSYDVELSEKVDCIISEILGNIMDNEDCVPILADAEKRFLKQDGFMLPKKVESFLVPVDHGDVHHLIAERNIISTHIESPLVETFSQLETPELYNFYYDSLIDTSSYLSESENVSVMEKGNYSEFYDKEFRFEITQSGSFTGFKGFFKADLNSDTLLTIESAENYSTSWKHAYFPIEKIIQVEKGDIIKLAFERKGDNKYIWQGDVVKDGKVIQQFKQELK